MDEDRKPVLNPTPRMHGAQVAACDPFSSSPTRVELTHGCFVTYPYHECGGQLTYSYVRFGSRILGYLELEDEDIVDHNVVLDAWAKYYDVPMPTDSYSKGIRMRTRIQEQSEEGTMVL